MEAQDRAAILPTDKDISAVAREDHGLEVRMETDMLSKRSPVTVAKFDPIFLRR
jgi:hypothetical protein